MMAAQFTPGKPKMYTNNRLGRLSVALIGSLPMLMLGCGDRSNEAVKAPASTTVGTNIDDTVITAKVKSALLADPEIKSFDLKVETRKGSVQLSGFVDNQTQVERAMTTAKTVAGVTSVENSVAIKQGKESVGNAIDDSVITAQVKAALLADPSITSTDIAVVTRKGEVQLSGYVNSLAQISQATGIAQKVNGVISINNEMSVKK
jgi:hyperosmotically inducible protein